MVKISFAKTDRVWSNKPKILTNEPFTTLSLCKPLYFCINTTLGGLLTVHSCRKLVRIMKETWSWYISTHTYEVSENKYFSTRTSLILQMSRLFGKNQHFSAKISPQLKAIVWAPCWRFFSSVFNFYKINDYY